MEFGFQDKRKSLVLLGLAVALAFAVIYAINNMPKEDTTGTSARAAAPAAGRSASLQNLTPAQRRRQQALDIYKIDPTIHVEKLTQAPTAEYTATRRNLFHYEAAPPPPPPQKTQKQIEEEKKALANRPPPPPPSSSSDRFALLRLRDGGRIQNQKSFSHERAGYFYCHRRRNHRQPIQDCASRRKFGGGGRLAE